MTWPLILSFRSVHDQNVKSVEGKWNGAVYPTPQSTGGSEGASEAPPYSGVGAELRPKTISMLSKRDKMRILDRQLDTVGCYRLRAAPK